MNISDFFGWQDRPEDVEKVLAQCKYPYMSGPVSQAICGSGTGKKQLLYKFVEKVAGKYPVRTQAIGDCVSFGHAGAIDCLKAAEIIINGDLESWQSETSTEDIYGGSRVQIGNGQLGNGDGSIGAWACKYISQYGTLLRKKYNNIDLSIYDGNRAKLWGSPNHGTPKELISIAKEHKVQTYTLVKTYQEVIDSIQNGFPVTICSNRGFENVRDRDGFCRASGRWGHCMLIHGFDDEYTRKGVCIQNSWGPNWVTGPKRNDQPDGSFWCSIETLENDILSGNDSWALSGFDGFPMQDLNWGDLFR